MFLFSFGCVVVAFVDVHVDLVVDVHVDVVVELLML